MTVHRSRARGGKRHKNGDCKHERKIDKFSEQVKAAQARREAATRRAAEGGQQASASA